MQTDEKQLDLGVRLVCIPQRVPPLQRGVDKATPTVEKDGHLVGETRHSTRLPGWAALNWDPSAAMQQVSYSFNFSGDEVRLPKAFPHPLHDALFCGQLQQSYSLGKQKGTMSVCFLC